MTAILTADEEKALRVEKIRNATDVNLPRLEHWNYDACKYHTKVGPQPDCDYQLCGGELFAHQRVGVAWAYFNGLGLLADDPGLGKTNVILALLALLKQRGELTNRALIIVQTPSTLQWAAEARRWTTGMHIEAAVGSMGRLERMQRYLSNWDILVVGFHTAIKDFWGSAVTPGNHTTGCPTARRNGRMEQCTCNREPDGPLAKLGPFAFVASDDVDPLLDPTNVTHHTIVRLSLDSTRSLTINATVLQTRLEQLHAALVPSGGLDVFGSETAFITRHVRKTDFKKQLASGKTITIHKAVGFKNMDELRHKLRPLYIRRRASEVSDVRMPKLMPPTTVWLEMSTWQKAAYAALKKKTLVLMKEDGTTYKAAEAAFMAGQMICAGAPALGEDDGSGRSPKLDWVLHHLTTVWTDRKVLVFVKNVGMVRALEARCAAQGIRVAKIWGQNQNAVQREEERLRFWNDTKTRVCVGTTAMERSLNLQVANTVVAVDTHLNWARMKQLLGRVMRAGSRHDSVYFFTLLMAATQEEGYEQILSERQALNDFVFDESTGIYKALSKEDLMKLIAA